MSHIESELTVENGLRMRLARLRAGSGDREGAIRLLMRPEVISTQMRPMRGQDERLMLAELLVELGRSAEAVQLGKQWISAMARAMDGRSPLSAALRCVRLQPMRPNSASPWRFSHPEIRFFSSSEVSRKWGSNRSHIVYWRPGSMPIHPHPCRRLPDFFRPAAIRTSYELCGRPSAPYRDPPFE